MFDYTHNVHHHTSPCACSAQAAPSACMHSLMDSVNLAGSIFVPISLVLAGLIIICGLMIPATAYIAAG